MRGRPPLLHPTRPLNTAIDEALMARVDLLLFSPLEGRVPKGAYQKYLSTLIRRSFEQQSLDLAPYLGTLPGERVIYGTREDLDALIEQLQHEQTI